MSEGLNPVFNPTKIELYESPLLAVSTTGAETLTWTHNLGFTLVDVEWVLVCIVADKGYAIGDEIYPNGKDYGAASSTTVNGDTVWSNATEVGIQRGSGANGLFWWTKNTGASASITYASWRAKIRGKRITIGDIPDIITVGMVPIETKTLRAVGQAGIVLPPGYEGFVVDIQKAQPATDNVTFNLRTGSDGATADVGVSDYSRQSTDWVSALAAAFDGTSDRLQLDISIGNAIGEWYSGQAYVNNPNDNDYSRLYGQGMAGSTTSNPRTALFSGWRKEQAAINYVEFYFSSGNIAEFTYTLYGLRKPA